MTINSHPGNVHHQSVDALADSPAWERIATPSPEHVFIRVITDESMEPVPPRVITASDLGRDMEHVMYGEDMPPHRLFWFDESGQPVEVALVPHPDHRPQFNSSDYATYIWQVVPAAQRGERRVITEASARIDGRA